MATACFRLVTFLPLPDFRVPSFFSFITLWTLARPLVAEFLGSGFLGGGLSLP